EKEAELHPIVDLTASLMTAGDEPCELTDPAKQQLTEALEKLAGTPELKPACGDLLRMAYWLDTEAGAPKAAQAIVEILETMVPALDAWFAEHDPDLADTKQKFDRFRDEEGPKAPRVGETAPEGSIKLGSLDYKKRG